MSGQTSNKSPMDSTTTFATESNSVLASVFPESSISNVSPATKTPPMPKTDTHVFKFLNESSNMMHSFGETPISLHTISNASGIGFAQSPMKELPKIPSSNNFSSISKASKHFLACFSAVFVINTIFPFLDADAAHRFFSRSSVSFTLSSRDKYSYMPFLTYSVNSSWSTSKPKLRNPFNVWLCFANASFRIFRASSSETPCFSIK
mmetsp:Transcript_3357/g.10334  ORF Transcript_3357/g.10334 Transcript_3357/m.10334 type:complete len:206 (-) Transcript_3357:140-757(-)